MSLTKENSFKVRISITRIYPHYRTGKTLLFRRSEIDAWLVRAVKYEYGDYFTKKRAFKDNPF